MNSYHLLPGPGRMIICEPVSTKGMAPRQMEELSARVRQVMFDTYYANSQVVAPEAASSGQVV